MYSLSNTGQVCCSIERIYVAESVYDEFQVLTKDIAKDYKVGNGMKTENNIGPLVSMIQKEHVSNQVSDAISKGAKLLHQSEIPNDESGSFYPVTVLSNVDDSMKLFTAETFVSYFIMLFFY